MCIAVNRFFSTYNVVSAIQIPLTLHMHAVDKIIYKNIYILIKNFSEGRRLKWAIQMWVGAIDPHAHWGKKKKKIIVLVSRTLFNLHMHIDNK